MPCRVQCRLIAQKCSIIPLRLLCRATLIVLNVKYNCPIANYTVR